jgi:hypothetical protein
MAAKPDVHSNDLPASALATWRAYEAMGESKRRHFEYLQYLENKYEKYGRPDSEESARLDRLLKQHDVRVKTFKSLLNQLRISDPAGYGAMVKKLSEQVA